MFIRYCLSRYENEQEGKAYRVYVTDALKLIAENTAKYAGGGYIQKRYVDVITPQKEEPRTPEEVTSHMLKKLRGR